MKYLLIVLFIGISLAGCNTLTQDNERGCTNYEPVCELYGQKRDCTYNEKGCKTCTCIPVGKPTSGDPARPNN